MDGQTLRVQKVGASEDYVMCRTYSSACLSSNIENRTKVSQCGYVSVDRVTEQAATPGTASDLCPAPSDSLNE